MDGAKKGAHTAGVVAEQILEDCCRVVCWGLVLCVSDVTCYSCNANGQFCVKMSQQKIST